MRTALAAFSLSAILAVSANGQERIYVANASPARFYSFSFDGSNFSADDLDPSAPGNGVGVGSGALGGFYVTDHLFLSAPGLQNLGLEAVDPFHKVELPRVRTTVTYGTIALSPAGDFAYLAGPDASSVATLSVID